MIRNILNKVHGKKFYFRIQKQLILKANSILKANLKSPKHCLQISYIRTNTKFKPLSNITKWSYFFFVFRIQI